MAIKQYNFEIVYNHDQVDFIEYLKPLVGKQWDKSLKTMGKRHGSGAERDRLKRFIRKELKDNQGDNCAFCGLSLKTRETHIEHIVPKGEGLYPQFMFEPKNLILACSLCNGFQKKKTYNTIKIYNDVYNVCKFKIVHPYFDNPDDHYEYINDPETNMNVIIRPKIISGVESIKAKTSIDLFELKDSGMVEARASEILVSEKKLEVAKENLLKQVLNRPYIS